MIHLDNMITSLFRIHIFTKLTGSSGLLAYLRNLLAVLLILLANLLIRTWTTNDITYNTIRFPSEQNEKTVRFIQRTAFTVLIVLLMLSRSFD